MEVTFDDPKHAVIHAQGSLPWSLFRHRPMSAYPCPQASNLGFFFLKPKEAISVRLREQAAAAAAQPSGEHENQYESFEGDAGALRL